MSNGETKSNSGHLNAATTDKAVGAQHRAILQNLRRITAVPYDYHMNRQHPQMHLQKDSGDAAGSLPLSQTGFVHSWPGTADLSASALLTDMMAAAGVFFACASGLWPSHILHSNRKSTSSSSPRNTLQQPTLGTLLQLQCRSGCSNSF